MNTFLIILFIIIVLTIISAIIYVTLTNKISETIIRINEAEIRIDNNLRDKFDILNKCISILKTKIKLDDNAFQDIIKLRARKISNFDLDRTLTKSLNDFLVIYDNNPELRKSDEIYKSTKQLELIDEELVTLRDYYNANILKYNSLIKKFPTNLIAEIKKYKERPFYDLKDLNDEDYEDFKL